jgi:hypothetical protein
MVQEYAKQVAQKLGKAEFKASNGWLGSFRKRHQIVFNELCGESSDVNSETIEEWVAKLPSIIQGYGQEFAAQQNDSDMLGVISQAKVFVESQAAKRVNCVQKTLLDYWKK